MPFQPKKNMKIAPSCRRDDFIKMNSDEKKEFYACIDQTIQEAQKDTNNKLNYLSEIKNNKSLIRKQAKTTPKMFVCFIFFSF